MKLKSGNGSLPYRLRNNFLSSPEMALLRVLEQMSDGHYKICPKVALNDIFYIARPNENVHFYNKIFRKHVDFLLCNPENMNPVFGVELVKPIAREQARESDQFMEDLFLQAGLTLVHVPTSDNYEIADLVHLFKLATIKANELNQNVIPNNANTAPACPKCGKMMVLRIYRDGPGAGKQYYGCMNNPSCSGVIPLE